MADATKIQGATPWIQLGDTITYNPSATTGSIDLGEGSIDEVLLIQVGHTDANVAGSNVVTVKVEIYQNGRWDLHAQFNTGGGTAVKEDVAAQSVSSQTHIEVADTTDWDTGLGERLLLFDTVDYTKSEIVEIAGWADNDYYLAQDNLENTHENTADLLDGLTETEISIPNGIRYARVNCHNSDDNANYLFRVTYNYVSEFV